MCRDTRPSEHFSKRALLLHRAFLPWSPSRAFRPRCTMDRPGTSEDGGIVEVDQALPIESFSISVYDARGRISIRLFFAGYAVSYS